MTPPRRTPRPPDLDPPAPPGLALPDVSEFTTPAVKKQLHLYRMLVAGAEIASDADAQRVYEGLQWVKGLLKRIGLLCDPVVKATRTAYTAALDQRKTLQAPFNDVDALGRDAISRWEERKEAARIAAAETAAAAYAAALAPAEVDPPDELPPAPTDVAAPLPAVVAPVVLARQSAVPTREAWIAELVDLRPLLAAVLAGTVPLAIVQLNPAVAQAAVDQWHEQLAAHYPGLRGRRVSTPIVRT